jgi:imidazolonepropionase-like amidohydrolase
LLGLADQLGTVEPGKVADLIATDADPLIDIGALGRPDHVVMVVKDGRIVKDGLPGRDAVKRCPR